MDNVIIGQYIPGKSILHRSDPRIKIIAMILLIVSAFLVPSLGYVAILLGIIIIVILITKIPISKVLNGLKGLVFLLSFTVVLQLGYITEGVLRFNMTFNMTWYNLVISVGLLILWLLTKKYIRFGFIYFLILIAVSFYLQYSFNVGPNAFSYTVRFYQGGIERAGFIFFRVIVVILISSLLTWTTNTIDLNNGFESIIKPLKLIKINTAVIAMMLSLVLRFVPTLLEESEKIMKAQASRGADFKEGRMQDKIRQIVSLLVPMFVISFKRAEDLANAMESRGYVIGAPRTKLDEMKIRFKDFLLIIFCILILTLAIWSNFL